MMAPAFAGAGGAGAADGALDTGGGADWTVAFGVHAAARRSGRMRNFEFVFTFPYSVIV
jgi:hypothetical protein